MLVEAVNPSAIAEGVFKLFENDRLRESISRVAREMVCKQFSWETICSDLMKAYREVLDTKAYLRWNASNAVRGGRKSRTRLHIGGFDLHDLPAL